MSGRGGFAYAQARLQSRLGASLAPDAMQQLLATRDLAGLLAAVRATPQRRYVARLNPGLDPHELERQLREEWIALVDEVAAWQPPAWRASVRWLRWLPGLPLLQKLARGGRPPAWARADPWLGRIVATDPALRGNALAAGPLQPLRLAFDADDHEVMAAWMQHWRALWPPVPPAAAALEAIGRDVAACDASLRDPATRDSSGPLRSLRQRLLRQFRRHPSSPAAAIAFLALEGLTLLSLRGGLMRRAVIEPGPA
jgi:hypothetical protein